MKTMRPEVLRSIERLVNDGATLLGEAPTQSPSLQNSPEAAKELTALAEKMWGDLSPSPSPQGRGAASSSPSSQGRGAASSSLSPQGRGAASSSPSSQGRGAASHSSTPQGKQYSYGKGKILSGMTIEEAFTVMGIIPDVKLDNKDFVYAHRTAAGCEIFFVANRSDKKVELSPEFRVVDKQPELWNAINGERRSLPAYIRKDNSTVIPLVFEPYESMFIVFAGAGKPQSSEIKDNFPTPEVLTEINTPWTVTFESDAIKRGPSGQVIFDKLQSWTENEDERIRYYSGTAVYQNVFILNDKPATGDIYIDLGKVCMTAKVKINGHCVGGVWTNPYRINITELVREGENTFEVEVINNWVNRLIGDSMVPENERVLNYPFESWMSKNLRESGLIGPVKILVMRNKF
jgi:hypothetical protein